MVWEGLRISLETLRLFLDNRLSLGRYHRDFGRKVGLAILEKEMYVSIEGFGGEHRLQKKDKRLPDFSWKEGITKVREKKINTSQKEDLER